MIYFVYNSHKQNAWNKNPYIKPHLPRTGVGWRAPREDWFLDEGPSIDCWKCIQRCIFPKIGVPQNGWFIMENPIKWMIWEYHYFRKHPYPKEWYICNCSAQLLLVSLSSLKKKNSEIQNHKRSHAFASSFALQRHNGSLIFVFAWKSMLITALRFHQNGSIWNIIWKASPDHFLSVSGCCLDWNWKKRMSLHLSTGFVVGMVLSRNVRTNFMKRSQKCFDSKAPGPVHQKFWRLQENWYFSVF